KPLDLDNWIEVDEHHCTHLAQKRQLYAEIPEKVFVAEVDTQAAQQEVLDLVTDHLRRHFPDMPSASPKPAGNLASQPICAASLLVQEDLILMRRSENGWRLVAGS